MSINVSSLNGTLSNILTHTYASQALEAIASRENLIGHLLTHRKCPINGWDDITIEMLIQRFSLMDSNNFMANCGIGERESRFASDIVSRRHFRMGHGIGRSGELQEIQPKAAGSSLMNKLANSLVLDLLQNCGAPNTKSCIIVPMATGMTLVLCMLTLRHLRTNGKYVIWTRIDQKSCFKCITTAGFIPLVIENKLIGDSLVTDTELINRTIAEYGADNILCILTTTSCFAPRHPDDLEAVAVLCKKYDIPHLVNNAYGVQSSKCMHLIEQSSRIGRVDAYIQSTDKNFMVPVGGSVIGGFDSQFINKISCLYPGRGSATPSMDMLITLLHLGINGYKELLKERKENMSYLRERLTEIANKFGERILNTKDNHISIAMTFDSSSLTKFGSEIGSMLFVRCVSGTRMISVNGDNVKTISGSQFKNWGSHCDSYPHTYMTAAAAIGIKKDDIDIFIKRLNNILLKLIKDKPSRDRLTE